MLRWSKEEDNLLRETNGEDYHARAKELGLPYRTPNAVRNRRNRIRVPGTQQAWSQTELDIISSLHPAPSEDIRAELLRYGFKRSRGSVTNKLLEMGLRRRQIYTVTKWTMEEEEFLIKHYPWMKTTKLLDAFNSRFSVKRGLQGVKSKAISLGLRKGVDYYNS